MSTPKINRQPEGIPAGGQFAASLHAEPEVALGESSANTRLDAVAAFELGKAGLQGELTPYTGSDPDAGEDAMTYVSPLGRELVISGAGTQNCMVHHFDPSGENTFHIGDIDGRNPSETVEALNSAVWDLEVRDAFDMGFRDGEVYEIRDTELGRTKDGDSYALMSLSDDEGNWSTVHHNYGTGITTIADDSSTLTGMAESITMDAIVTDMAEEPTDGNLPVAMARAFERIRADAVKVPGSGEFISPRELSRHESQMHEYAAAVQEANPGMSTQAARNISAVGAGAEIGLAYLDAAKKNNEAGNQEAAAMYLIGTQAVKNLPAKMLDHKNDTARMREDIEEARTKLRRDGSMLDAFAHNGRQPIFKQLDDTLREVDGFISGP